MRTVIDLVVVGRVISPGAHSAAFDHLQRGLDDGASRQREQEKRRLRHHRGVPVRGVVGGGGVGAGRRDVAVVGLLGAQHISHRHVPVLPPPCLAALVARERPRRLEWIMNGLSLVAFDFGGAIQYLGMR